MKEIKKYHPNGQIHQHYYVDENNKIQGEYKSCYDNGQLEHQCFFKNGLKEGEYKHWHSNGQLSYHCFYKNGLKEGENKIWYKNGQMAYYYFYNNGLLEGECKSWHSNGQIWEHLFYHKDNIIDITTYVTDKNNITEEEYFLLQITFVYFPLIKFNGTL